MKANKGGRSLRLVVFALVVFCLASSETRMDQVAAQEQAKKGTKGLEDIIARLRQKAFDDKARAEVQVRGRTVRFEPAVTGEIDGSAVAEAVGLLVGRLRIEGETSANMLAPGTYYLWLGISRYKRFFTPIHRARFTKRPRTAQSGFTSIAIGA